MNSNGFLFPKIAIKNNQKNIISNVNTSKLFFFKSQIKLPALGKILPRFLFYVYQREYM
jgi:hypothetical protein